MHSRLPSCLCDLRITAASNLVATRFSFLSRPHVSSLGQMSECTSLLLRFPLGESVCSPHSLPLLPRKVLPSHCSLGDSPLFLLRLCSQTLSPSWNDTSLAPLSCRLLNASPANLSFCRANQCTSILLLNSLTYAGLCSGSSSSSGGRPIAKSIGSLISLPHIICTGVHPVASWAAERYAMSCNGRCSSQSVWSSLQCFVTNTSPSTLARKSSPSRRWSVRSATSIGNSISSPPIFKGTFIGSHNVLSSPVGPRVASTRVLISPRPLCCFPLLLPALAELYLLLRFGKLTGHTLEVIVELVCERPCTSLFLSVSRWTSLATIPCQMTLFATPIATSSCALASIVPLLSALPTQSDIGGPPSTFSCTLPPLDQPATLPASVTVPSSPTFPHHGVIVEVILLPPGTGMSAGHDSAVPSACPRTDAVERSSAHQSFSTVLVHLSASLWSLERLPDPLLCNTRSLLCGNVNRILVLLKQAHQQGLSSVPTCSASLVLSYITLPLSLYSVKAAPTPSAPAAVATCSASLSPLLFFPFSSFVSHSVLVKSGLRYANSSCV
ncbi:hypothetical protein C7M84_014783 [Penaeus vannamei]|uniref:Uncharacterized protein n=1 Tax=Penaeus vannamei TaxID=6689 RepID=A0A3R7M4R6_PENVA|nr:hypothetical protein C7M84_014783 [Penaeus vannamei]